MGETDGLDENVRVNMTAWQALGIGISLGLGAGITPGPLLGLVMNETLRGGWRSGVLVALAPLLADIAIIALCLFVLIRLPPTAFSVLSLCGGLYVMFLGWETLRTTPMTTLPLTGTMGDTWRSFGKGIAVNLLNPHPYLFWLTVGTPLLTENYRQSALGAILTFLGGFYSCLVGSKILLALLVHNSRMRLQGRGYRLALQVTGGLLLSLGALLVWEGVPALVETPRRGVSTPFWTR